MSRIKAILSAVLVTVLWSSSWVLIKIGLQNQIPPLTFAGVRYFLAFICLIPLILLNKRYFEQVKSLKPKDWLNFAILGILFNFITQGAQFVSLGYLNAANLGLIINLTPVIVTGFSFLTNSEKPSKLQSVALLIAIAGVMIYFYPFDFPEAHYYGIIAAVVCLLANSAGALKGRTVNRDATVSALVITTISMGFGSVLLLSTGIIVERDIALTSTDIYIILWLAVVNTSFAFTLWNKTLKVLTAVESSVINGLMLPQIALLAYFFLDESLTSLQIVALVVVISGVLLVQIAPKFAGRK